MTSKAFPPGWVDAVAPAVKREAAAWVPRSGGIRTFSMGNAEVRKERSKRGTARRMVGVNLDKVLGAVEVDDEPEV